MTPYLICLVGELVTCYPATEVTGWQFCMDKPPAAGGVLTETAQAGRFVAYDDNPACGPVGCVVASGRFTAREVLRNDAGAAYATGIILSDEMADGFEPLDQFPTSACTFSRFLPTE